MSLPAHDMELLTVDVNAKKCSTPLGVTENQTDVKTIRKNIDLGHHLV